MLKALLWLSFSLLITSPQPVGVHVEEADALGPALAIAHQVKDALEAHGVGATVDNPDWARCDVGRCLSDVRVRTRASTLLMLRIFAGPTRTRVFAELLGPDDQPVASAHTDLPQGGTAQTRKAKLQALVVQLFPSPKETPAVRTAPKTPTTVQAGPGAGPWFVLGGSGLALALGIGFGLSSQSARGQLEGQVLVPAQLAQLEDRLSTHALVANTMFATAALSAVSAALWYWLDR